MSLSDSIRNEAGLSTAFYQGGRLATESPIYGYNEVASSVSDSLHRFERNVAMSR